ncbi:hypothetical protein L226DRAFT_567521 [Lentinus tigrinus ALCF2SS1-7]|uniref:Uncharacterized protein n=1 Tax=Lentinus tigrinus ALCF2SS1-6 TaxID=1328759 RepID=A0A5C2SNH6_9APHY|nr:hypothetical protein L227DRAFT_606754 [Lentinus tigrinus ALCF2SS1-6]RPD79401.1 hypothetical protein L226DRAFT_567521 [Lentinus tigrinus ALCF2SS1-7]
MNSDNFNNSSSNSQFGQSGQQQQAGGEKQDWLDKGVESAGDKAGVDISNQNADKAGDFANKEFKQKEGFGLPGVH